MLFTTLLLSLLPAVRVVHGADWDPSRHAWYATDSNNDFHNTTPIGNGRLGAMVFGSIMEKLVLNENSVWSGPWQNRVNTKSKGALEDIWKNLVNGQITAAGTSALSNMAGNPESPRAYNPLVNLALDFGHGAISSVTNYSRWLDTFEGTSGVSYVKNGVSYTREYVASHPHGVLAFRLSSSGKGQLNVKVSLSREKWVLSQAASIERSNSTGHTVALSANSGQSSEAITFWSEARVVNTGGTVTSDGKTVSISGADTVDIFFDAETSYRYPDATQARAELQRKLDTAVSAGYPSVRKAAVDDFTRLTQRVKLNLGSSPDAKNIPTSTRLANFKKSPAADQELITLMYNFGRHNLIASSRNTGARSLPANLQGLWNQDYSPAWQSKYTININLEMNYWPAAVTDLAEVQKPVFDLLVNMAIPRGQAVAKTMYGCDQGFVLHHNTDIWGDAAPVDKGTPYTVWPMGAAWLSHDAMEHYRFTQNSTFLRGVAWPILQQTSQFLFCYLKLYNGFYTLGGPSLSPEHAFVVPSGLSQQGKQEGLDISIEMDNQLLRTLFSNIIETCALLNLSAPECDKASTYVTKIRPPGISPKTNRIQEWRADYPESEAGHRHFSPLFGLFPGSEMTPLVNSTLSAASKRLLDYRISSGSGSTGWSRTWAINLYARLFEGDTAWRHITEFIQKFPSNNLWNSDSGPGSSFQIDGNFGFVAGLSEMLVQSQHVEGKDKDKARVIHLLPAIGKSVKKGSVEGLVGRGNFVVEYLGWEDGGKFVEARIRSRAGGVLGVRVGDGRGRVEVDGVVVGGGIETVVGGVYQVRVVG